MISSLFTFFNELITILAQMAPYLLLGFFIAGILHVYMPQRAINKYFAGKGFWPAFNAALFGVPLPLCSCGVIPTGMALYKNGASKSSTVSFLISTPQTGVDSILATYSLLGLPMAIIRPIIAFITGVFGGIFTGALTKNESQNTFDNTTTKQKKLLWHQKIVAVFKYGFFDFLQDISKWLVIGLVIAAIISVIIPDNFFVNLNLPPIYQMLIILAFSAPLYICATASVPLAAVLILKGVSPGAALILLMAGPATNAATITMIGKVMGKKALISYLISIIGGAMFFALIIDYALPQQWFAITDNLHAGHHNHNATMLLNNLSAIILSVLLLFVLTKKYFIKNKPTNVQQKQYIIEGMNCNHCKTNVETSLQKLDFIKTASVNLANKTVTIDADIVDENKIAQTINGLGYKFIGLKN